MHTALPLALGTLALLGTLFVNTLVPTILVLCVAITAASMIKGPFWALASEMLPPTIAATAIGQINALNNLGVFVGTYAIGAIRQSTGSFAYSLAPLVAVSFIACLVALWIGHVRQVNGAVAKTAPTPAL